MKTTRYAGMAVRQKIARRFKSPETVFEEDPLKNTLFPKSPKKPEAPPPVPEADGEAVQEARDAERRRRKKRSGRKSTILTSELGDVADPTLEKKELLGS